jgi:DNA repair exonuclease SbcCD nuclease subunit
MSTIKGVYYTDVHLQDKNPASRKGNFLEEVMTKLEYIGSYANKKKCDFSACGGDLFNIKTPSKNSYSMVNGVIDMYSNWRMVNLLLEGNHDIMNDRSDTIDSQPIGALFRSGHVIHLRNELIEKKNLKVRIQGYDFIEEPDFDQIKLKEEDKVDVNILVLHAYAGPVEADLFGTKIHGYPEISQTGHDIYLFGHYHKNQGIHTLDINGKTQHFVNLGSVTRGDYGDYNLERIPQFCYLEISKKNKDSEVEITLTPEDLPCKDGKDVFDVEQKEREKFQEQEAQKFVEKLQMASIANDLDSEEVDTEDKELEEEIQSLDLTKDVMKEVRRFLNEASEAIGGVH